MSWGNDPYNNPEKHGLTIVETRDVGAAYEFDMFVIWRDGDEWFWADDAGCSCPSPFENYTDRASLNHGDRGQAYTALDEWERYHKERGY